VTTTDTIHASLHDATLRMAMGASCLAAAAPGTPSASRAIVGVLYSGGLLNMGWSGSYVVDLRGIAHKDRLPLLHGHDSYSADGRIGFISASVEAGPDGLQALMIRGQINTSEETGRKVVADLEFGVPLETSVGLDPIETRSVAAGETVQVNGRTLTGPFTLVTKSLLREASVVTLGADSQTSVALAARRARATHSTPGSKGLTAMDQTDPTAAPAPTTAPATDTIVDAMDSPDATPDMVKISDITYAWLMEYAPDALKPAEAAASVEELEAAYAGCPGADALVLASLKARHTAPVAQAAARKVLHDLVVAQAEQLSALRASRDPVASAAVSAAAVSGITATTTGASTFAGCAGVSPEADWANSPELRAEHAGCRASFLRYAAMQQRDGLTWTKRCN
jgi:hypothetical protein